MNPRALGLALLTAGLVLAPSSARAEATIPASEYVQRLDRARETALAAVSAPTPVRMQEVRDAVGLPLVVVIGRQQFRVDRDPLLEELGGDSPADFRAAVRRLASLANQVRQAIGRTEPPRSRVQTALDHAYRNLRSSRPGFLQSLRRAVTDFLQWVVDRLFSLRGPGTLFAWLVVLALLLPLVPLARRLGVVPDRVLTGRRGERLVQTDWYARADEALARGDLGAAIAALYAALLSTLSDRGVVTWAPSLTAAECRTAVARARPALYPLVEVATVAFERVAYGRESPASRDIQALQQAASAARAA